MITFEQKLVIAEQYVEACNLSLKMESTLQTFLKSLTSDQFCYDGYVDIPLEPVDAIARAFLDSDEYGWLGWWVYDAECGSKDLTFVVDGVEYNPQSLSTGEFFELVWK